MKIKCLSLVVGLLLGSVSLQAAMPQAAGAMDDKEFGERVDQYCALRAKLGFLLSGLAFAEFWNMNGLVRNLKFSKNPATTKQVKLFAFIQNSVALIDDKRAETLVADVLGVKGPIQTSDEKAEQDKQAAQLTQAIAEKMAADPKTWIDRALNDLKAAIAERS